MRALLVVAIASALASGCRQRADDALPTGSTGAPRAATSDGGVVGDGAIAAAQLVPAGPVVPRPPKVRITVRSFPRATVSWGRKGLGVTPVQIDRPRDSGPLDLVLRSSGRFPVHTRAYTYHNDTISVKLTKLGDRMTLFGAKKELPPPTPATPDGGAPPQPAPAAPAPTTVPPKG